VPVLKAAGMGFGKIAQSLRAAVTGTAVSPARFEILELIEKERAVA
jgi:hypothetical protein